MHLSGKTGDYLIMRNAESLYMPIEYQKHINYIEKYDKNQEKDEENCRKLNEQIYDVLLDKFSVGKFKTRAKTVGKVLISGKNDFAKLSVDEQFYVLKEILNMSTIGTETADLKLIGGKKGMGKFVVTKKISEMDSCELIDCSYTGLFNSDSIDLKTL